MIGHLRGGEEPRPAGFHLKRRRDRSLEPCSGADPLPWRRDNNSRGNDPPHLPDWTLPVLNSFLVLQSSQEEPGGVRRSQEELKQPGAARRSSVLCWFFVLLRTEAQFPVAACNSCFQSFLPLIFEQLEERRLRLLTAAAAGNKPPNFLHVKLIRKNSHI